MENIYTQDELYEDFVRLGVMPGSALLLHSSLSSIGYVVGGAISVINALRRCLGSEGTLCVPTHTPELSDPENWHNPLVPLKYWEKIREGIPLFDPQLILPVSVGIIPCTILGYSGVRRSSHPIASIAALGRHANFITSDHSLHEPEGWSSPVGRLYELDGWILLLGVDNRRNTSLHLAESAADVPYIKMSAGKPNDRVKVQDSQGEIRFVRLTRSAQCSEGFIQAEPYLRRAGLITYGQVGDAPCQLMRQRPVVDLFIQLLKDDPTLLLCDDANCRQCATFHQQLES
ncbi:MAG: AAC(3) family N-acetyltransferase [Acidobacteriota bacterium]